jgi:uncharacterized membrane protein
MHCLLVVVFDNETDATAGKTELLRLDHEGTISVYGYAVIGKNPDDVVAVTQLDSYGTLSPCARTFLESLSDQTDVALEAGSQASDETAHLSVAKTRKGFIDDVREVLLPHRVAIVAEVQEEWPPVVDSRLEPIGGIVFRWTVSEIQDAAET